MPGLARHRERHPTSRPRRLPPIATPYPRCPSIAGLPSAGAGSSAVAAAPTPCWFDPPGDDRTSALSAGSGTSPPICTAAAPTTLLACPRPALRGFADWSTLPPAMPWPEATGRSRRLAAYRSPCRAGSVDGGRPVAVADPDLATYDAPAVTPRPVGFHRSLSTVRLNAPAGRHPSRRARRPAPLGRARGGNLARISPRPTARCPTSAGPVFFFFLREAGRWVRPTPRVAAARRSSVGRRRGALHPLAGGRRPPGSLPRARSPHFSPHRYPFRRTARTLVAGGAGAPGGGPGNRRAGHRGPLPSGRTRITGRPGTGPGL